MPPPQAEAGAEAQSDTVEIPLDAEPTPEPALASEEADTKELPPAPTTPKTNDATQGDKATTDGIDSVDAPPSTEAGNNDNDNAPPPPPPKTQPETPAKPTLPRGTSTASMQEVALSRGPTPGSVPERTPSASTGVEAASASPSRNPASASVTSLASMTMTSPSRPTSAAHRPRMTGEHSRRSSMATTISLTGPGQSSSGATPPQLSSVLITPPLKVLVDSKEAKKSPSFAAAAQRALELCSQEGPSNEAYMHPREIFEPLRLAISNPQTTSVPILITSLDLLSKLVSHSFFSEPDGPPKGMSPLPDLITHTIILAYSETSPPQVALQVVKALMAIVLSTDRGMLVHQSSLLKAVRTVYNVFILSNDAANQVVAQGGLTQMVHHVFGRVIRPNPNKPGMGGRRSTVGENEARRIERESMEMSARSETEAQGEEANGNGNGNGNGGEQKLTLYVQLTEPLNPTTFPVRH